MIDRIKFIVPLDEPQNFKEYYNEQVEYLGFDFNPVYNELNYPKYYIHKNLQFGFTLKLFSEKVQFEGSVHKLFNKLHGKKGNHDDFTFSKLTTVINWLETVLECNSSNMVIRNVEIGVNVKLNFPLELYFKNVQAYQRKKIFVPMLKFNRVYGKFCSLSQYRIKLYDKEFESEVHQNKSTQTNLLRYEIAYSKMQPLKNVLSVVSDLKSSFLFSKLGDILVSKFSQINFSNLVYDASILSSNDRQFFYAGQNPTFWIDEKVANPKGQYNLRAKHKRLSKKLEVDSNKNYTNLIDELVTKVFKKINELKA